MDDEGRDRAIDEYLATYRMPAEYAAWRSVILWQRLRAGE